MQTAPEKIIRTTQAGVQQIQCILHWPHQKGQTAHCLARLYLWQTQPKAIAVISEIESNPLGLEVADDFPGVVRALLKQFRAEIEPRLENMVWIVHHGRFSFYEALHQEAFSRVDLKISGEAVTCELDDWYLLSAAEMQALLAGVTLAPVTEVLKALGWA
jgi:hypothetical protein